MNPTPTKPHCWRPNIVFVILVGLLFSLSAIGQPAFLKDGLVAYYPFNGNANDESGNGNNGFSNTALLAKDRFGRGDASYYFNGLNSCIQVGDSFNLRPSTFTVSAWVLGNNYNGFNQIITKNAGVGKTESINLVINNNNGWNLTAQVGSPAAYGTLLRSPSSISESAWHQVVFTFAGAGQVQSIFLDGNLLSKNIASDSVVYDNSPWTIGAQFESQKLSYFFDGNIDDVRIYNRALSDTEIKVLYAYESTPPDNSFITNGLVAYYPFNGNANDESGYVNNAEKVVAGFGNDRFLKNNSAVTFNGNQFIQIPDKPQIGQQLQQQITLSLWASRSDNSLRHIIGKRGAAGVWQVFSRGNAAIGYTFKSGAELETEWNQFPLNKWKHIVLTYDGMVARIYADGTSVAEKKLTGFLDNTVGIPLVVGGSANFEKFNGSIDDLRIYNRAFSPAEVKALYDYESTPPDDSFITNGLVAYYPFNGNANDESGNGNTGQISGPTLAPDRFGYGNSAYDFSSNKGDKVLVSHNPSLNIVGDLTISSWVKVADLPQYRTAYTIVAKREQGGSQMPYLMGVNMQYGLPDDYNRFMFGSANGSYQFKQSVQLPNKSWCQVATSISGSQIAFYLNGELVGLDTVNPSLRALNNGPLVIGSGQRTDIPAEFFNGLIDDVRIYNRSFSDAEMKALYGYESQPRPNNPSVATATAQVVNGFVVGATITSGGNGYTNNPVVSITGGGGTGAKAIAFQVNGVVTSITITNPGSGYTSAPTITIAPPPFPPKKATATSQVVNGFVVVTTITDAGFGYDAPPSVLLVGGGGTGATATATVQNGVVTAITITNPGTGYTSAPLVRIASPPFTPKLAIEVSKVNVRLSVVLGRKYQIESSSDLTNWKPASAVFVAQDEELVQEFDVNTTGNYYRINQVP